MCARESTANTFQTMASYAHTHAKKISTMKSTKETNQVKREKCAAAQHREKKHTKQRKIIGIFIELERQLTMCRYSEQYAYSNFSTHSEARRTHANIGSGWAVLCHMGETIFPKAFNKPNFVESTRMK